MENENVVYENNKKSKKGVFLVFAIVIVLIGIVLTGVGVMLLSKPKAIFQESYNYLTKGFKGLELSDYKSVDVEKKDKVKVSSNINVNLNENLGLGITNVDLNLQLLEDKVNKTSKFYLDSKLENQKLLEFISYLKDNKMYLTIPDIFDKYYYTDVEYSSIYDNMNEEDIELLVDIVEDSFKKVITDEKFEKEKAKTSIDGIEESVTKLTLKVDDKLLSELVTEIINNIKNNKDAVDFLVEISESNKEEFLKFLDDALEELKDTTGETLFTYNIYYKGINDIRKLEILGGTSVLSYTANNNSYRLKYVEDDVEQLTILVSKKESKYDISVNTSSFKINGDLVKNKNGYSMTLNMVDGGSNDLGTLKLEYIFTSNVQDKLVIAYQKDKVDMIKVTIDSKIAFNESIKLPDLSNSKSIDSITDEEINKIMTNFQNHQIIGPIISMFLPENGLTNGNSTSTSDPYFDIYQ